MLVEGSFAVQAPKDRVWAFFLNPKELSDCIQDPHSIEVVDEDNFRGQMRTGVAFIRGTFNFSAKVVERDPPEKARIRMHGSGMGSAFDVDSNIHLAEAEGKTMVRWSADVAMSGTIASMGARLLKGAIDKKTNEFFENARKKLEG
jgi:carbon monoxide dehydrogenase subunit G